MVQKYGQSNNYYDIIHAQCMHCRSCSPHSQIQKQEVELLQYATQELGKIDGIKFVGTAEEKVSVISFNIEGCHPYDIGTIVDKLGVAVRTGHHCTQPIMQFFDIPGTIRASFMFYNTKDDVDVLVHAVKKATMMLL